MSGVSSNSDPKIVLIQFAEEVASDYVKITDGQSKGLHNFTLLSPQESKELEIITDVVVKLLSAKNQGVEGLFDLKGYLCTKNVSVETFLEWVTAIKEKLKNAPGAGREESTSGTGTKEIIANIESICRLIKEMQEKARKKEDVRDLISIFEMDEADDESIPTVEEKGSKNQITQSSSLSEVESISDRSNSITDSTELSSLSEEESDVEINKALKLLKEAELELERPNIQEKILFRMRTKFKILGEILQGISKEKDKIINLYQDDRSGLKKVNENNKIKLEEEKGKRSNKISDLDLKIGSLQLEISRLEKQISSLENKTEEMNTKLINEKGWLSYVFNVILNYFFPSEDVKKIEKLKNYKKGKEEQLNKCNLVLSKSRLEADQLESNINKLNPKTEQPHSEIAESFPKILSSMRAFSGSLDEHLKMLQSFQMNKEEQEKLKYLSEDNQLLVKECDEYFSKIHKSIELYLKLQCDLSLSQLSKGNINLTQKIQALDAFKGTLENFATISNAHLSQANKKLAIETLSKAAIPLE